MSTSLDLSRRRILKALSGAPLLPLAAGSGTSFLLAACGGSSAAIASTDLASVTFSAASFNGMAAPTLANAAAMATTTVASSLTASYSDGTKQNYALAYETFFITGGQVPNGTGGTTLSGGYYDINNQPIADKSAAGNPQFYSDCPDGSSLLTLSNPAVAGVSGNTVFAVVQFEYTSRDAAGNSMYGRLPSPIAVLTLDQNKTTGRLSLVKYSNVDTSAVHGLWITCGASRSPWNTHLSSEEYEPDATAIATNAQFQAFSQNLYGDPTRANPYHYGHLPEVTVNPDGTGSIRKHYCLGRISHELVQVMPDERTVLMGDDATNGGLFMFIADAARDLSSGTLYVAKWNQKTAENGGSADLGWIKLGKATSAEIKTLADTLGAADILDVKTADPSDASYTRIAFSGKSNWVKFMPGKEKAAAFLETHRYAAFKGGSLGFTKMEGTTVNARDKIAYLAMSYIQAAMKNGSGGISVQGPNAGAIYALNLKGGQTDDTGAAIDSQWVPVDMAALLLGEDLSAPDALGNLANPDKIANPDNIKFSEKLRTLFIGEDSGLHVNNFLWAYNVDTKLLSRVMSCPAGAESTGLHAVDDINGFAYIMSNFQHPGDWELTRDANGNVTGGLHSKVYATLDPLEKQNYRNLQGAAVGYLTGLPTLG
ncbi:PhoX family protein [Noviherbaspirillum sp.]|uniref:PhoX family protein n=1 Tax=Noviherbaspirillum sp. TaxID=1926288 RepID=UPI002B476CF3|nr:alkaline phosphatase PhoX [Noviherbaspirillum sp.]HJV82021.1 alkaline phosphatase PhoX [Noviherbaspirillum sp.]